MIGWNAGSGAVADAGSGTCANAGNGAAADGGVRRLGSRVLTMG